MMTPISVAIQAGGQSSRMGTDKSFVLFEGRPMIEVVLERVRDLGSETIHRHQQAGTLCHLGLPTVADIYPDHGPLGGIFTAVSHAAHPHPGSRLRYALAQRPLLAYSSPCATPPTWWRRCGKNSRNRCTPFTARRVWPD
jgi:hypothetical protein